MKDKVERYEFIYEPGSTDQQAPDYNQKRTQVLQELTRLRGDNQNQTHLK